MSDFETPSFEQELSRKTIDTLIDLETRRESGKLNQREFEVALQAVFSVVSGLTCELEFDPFEMISQLSASVVKDASFVDCIVSRSGFDDKFVMVRHRKNAKDAVIVMGTIDKEAHKSATEEETPSEFIKRLNDNLAKVLPNFEVWA